ncbi:MAG: hypothetical protein AAFQ82_04205 [Myxococcota bacterium]
MPVKVFGIVLAAGCVLAAGAGVATARLDAAPTPQDLRWARYPHHQVLSGGDAVRSDGLERELAYFASMDDPIAIIDHYDAYWRSQGFEITRRYNDEEELLSASDGVERRSVVVTRQGRVSVVWASRRILEDRSYSVRLPLDGRCTPMHHSASQDGSVLRELATVRCELSGDALLEFYQERFGAPQRRLRDGRRAFGSFADDTESLDVSVYSDERDGAPVSTATLRWEQRR